MNYKMRSIDLLLPIRGNMKPQVAKDEGYESVCHLFYQIERLENVPTSFVIRSLLK